MNDGLSLNAGKAGYQAEIVTIENCAVYRRPQMATFRWLTWKDNYKIQVNDLRPILSSINRRDRKQTDRCAPPTLTAKARPRNNKRGISSIAISCPEPTYLTRAATHVFTPPDTPAKEWEVIATSITFKETQDLLFKAREKLSL
jgi:hypothetical protein